MTDTTTPDTATTAAPAHTHGAGGKHISHVPAVTAIKTPDVAVANSAPITPAPAAAPAGSPAPAPAPETPASSPVVNSVLATLKNTPEEIAQVAHAVTTAGSTTATSWAETADATKADIVAGVKAIVVAPTVTAENWVYNEVSTVEGAAKSELVKFEALPAEAQTTALHFFAVVKSMLGFKS